MFGAILKAINSSFQQSMLFCLSIYIKKVMKLLESYLPSTTPFYASVSKGAANTIFTPLVWCGPDSNPRPPVPKANALTNRAIGAEFIVVLRTTLSAGQCMSI